MAKTASTKAAAKPAKTATPKAMTKAALIAELAGSVEGINKKQAGEFLDQLAKTASGQLTRVGVFLVPGITKLRVAVKAARPERAGINPLTKQPITVKAQPASRVVRAKIVSELRTAVSG